MAFMRRHTASQSTGRAPLVSGNASRVHMAPRKLTQLEVVLPKRLGGTLDIGQSSPSTVQFTIGAPITPIPTSPTGWFPPDPSGSFSYGIRLPARAPSAHPRAEIETR